MLARNGFLLGLLGREGRVVDAEGVVADGFRSRIAEDAREETRIGVLEVTARAVPIVEEDVCGLLAHAPEDLHRLRGEESADGVRLERHDEESVRLVLLRGDLREQAVGGEAHGARDAAFRLHFRAEAFRERAHVAEKVDRAGDVEERLVHGHALHERRVVREHLERDVRYLLIRVHARRHEDGVRAEGVGRAARHGGMHAVGPRLVGTGRDDAALVRARPYDDGFPAPFGVVSLLYRRKERVHVYVQNGHAGKIIPIIRLSVSQARVGA